MIQRVQSVLLLLVMLLMCGSIFFTGWSKENKAQTEKYELSPTTTTKYEMQGNSYQVVEQTSNYTIAVLAFLAAGVALFSIFQYKNRPLQIKLGFLISLLIAGNVGVLLFTSKELEKSFATDVMGQYSFGLYLPMVALLCNILSNRFIHRDERLVRSMDRIR
jgi:peptidoglycan/LPS O-acetylase OafA/YrhL